MWRRHQALLDALLWLTLLGIPTWALAATAPRDADGMGSSRAAVTIDPAASMAGIGATDLYLQTTINGRQAGLAHFGIRNGQLLATHATLRLLGMTLPPGLPDPVRLDRLPGVQVHFDQVHQQVVIVAPLALLNLPSQVLHTRRVKPTEATISPGMLLNYHLYGTRDADGNGSLSAFSEWRAFNRYGVFSNTALTRLTGRHGNWGTRAVRMDTSWSMSFPGRMLTLRLGDSVTDMAPWSRSIRLAGVQIGTDFALQPYQVTTPLAEFIGKATLPSKVELYIDGMQRYSTRVPAGQFKLDAVPGITGTGQAQLVLTDALGQATTMDFSLYGTQQLLRKGLSDWSLASGVVRRDYGLESFAYASQPVVSGTWRHGISDTFTATLHGEAARGLFNAGAGGDWLLGNAGVVSASLAQSGDNGTRGAQWSLGYRWNSPYANLSIHGTHADSGYRDIASRHGMPPARFSGSAQVGFNTPRLGSFSVGYVRLRMHDEPANRYASAWWHKSLGTGMSLSINVNQNLEHSRDRSLFFSFSMPLDDRTYVSTGMQHQGNDHLVTAQASHSIPAEGGLGWRAQMQQGNRIHAGQAELDYLGQHGRVQAGIRDYAGASNAFASADGSLVLMGGDVFVARSIYNGFAVVSTNGMPQVPIKLENNLVGRTNQHGLLLVTKLNAWQRNKISIDPMQLPADVRVRKVDLNATPSNRAGTLVRFDIEPVRAATIILVDANGKPLPLGSRVRRRGQQGQPALVGFDGVVYLDTLEARDTLDVDTPEGRCHVSFDYHSGGPALPQIGPLTCTEGNAP